MSANALRIALLTHSVNPRGGVVHTLELANALTAAGHDVTVFVPASAGEHLFRLPSCRVVYAPITASQKGTVAMVAARIHAFKQSLREEHAGAFDILHAQDSISGNALAELKQEGIIRHFVRTVHHLDHFDDAQLAKWQTRAWREADQVLCVSATWTREMQLQHGVEAVTVPNGVDTTRFDTCPTAMDASLRQRLGLVDGPLVLAVGGIEARKNTLALLDAFASVRAVMPTAQLVIAGGASLLDHDAYTHRFVERAAALGLSIGPDESVIITGPLDDAVMPALFRSADVLAMVSLREGFGLVVLEALACGTPVVASAIAPFTEYLDETTCCWAVPTDAASIAAALLRVLRGDCRTDFAQAVPALLARFSWASSTCRHLDAYRALLLIQSRSEPLSIQ
ncbi:MSMEG_0565 family glycosyltransferase [Paraburkholderia sp. DHOC27]|uniref:MSMEG_0565 family glycosyltransferase n=1 Tax=Paraburkholderia sp. DHOC27 TaxID=2303330 RepID=UPI000E3CDE8B|nr:MSMEG_0565 family glycosyltransferase [Paraburkholderia sp. DHOC27]RFU46522.1 MSMEG_0565 family glycosyltransferase [Paraburkholderia sp. DHOC27]